MGSLTLPASFMLPAVLFLSACDSVPTVPTRPDNASLTLQTAPGQKGSNNVGFRMFTATMTGGRLAQVQVHYPTGAAPDCTTKYQIPSAGLGAYYVSSPMCAVENAGVAPGAHPMIIYDHGGPIAGASFQLGVQIPLQELLASHGFIVVLALHSADAAVRIRDLRLLTDLMVAKNADAADAFSRHVDTDRIGTSGFSAGAASSFNFAAGSTAFGIGSDPRIKALVMYEPPPATLPDAANLLVPYLIMGGSQFANAAFAPQLFAATTGAAPRLYVKNLGAVHVSHLTGLCGLIQDAREAALALDPTIPEPLTTLSASNLGARDAYGQWNAGELALPIAGLGFGGGRNICNHVGVSSNRPLDQDSDGFTDSPPFYTGVSPFVDPTTVGPAPIAEVTAPLVELYTVAFWKTFLQGDRRYMTYLSPGYAQAQGLPVIVDIEP
jgi:hypothetical protein